MEFVPPLSQHNIFNLILHMNNWKDNDLRGISNTEKNRESLTEETGNKILEKVAFCSVVDSDIASN